MKREKKDREKREKNEHRRRLPLVKGLGSETKGQKDKAEGGGNENETLCRRKERVSG